MPRVQDDVPESLFAVDAPATAHRGTSEVLLLLQLPERVPDNTQKPRQEEAQKAPTGLREGVPPSARSRPQQLEQEEEEGQKGRREKRGGEPPGDRKIGEYGAGRQ